MISEYGKEFVQLIDDHAKKIDEVFSKQGENSDVAIKELIDHEKIMERLLIEHESRNSKISALAKSNGYDSKIMKQYGERSVQAIREINKIVRLLAKVNKKELTQLSAKIRSSLESLRGGAPNLASEPSTSGV